MIKVNTEGVTIDGLLTLIKCIFQSGLLIKYGRGFFYIDVRIEGNISYLVGGWLNAEDVNPDWGCGSRNHNRLMESSEMKRISDSAARTIEPLAGERSVISTPERLSEVIQEIGEDKVKNAIYDIIKDR